MTLPGNFICRPYRGVSVQHWTEALDEAAVKGVLLSREAYRRTEFVVLRAGDGTAAVVRITTASQEALFNPITAVEWLAGPDDCVYLVRPDVDSANATALAEAALAETALSGPAGQPGPPAMITIVEGRYQHVNFIVRPQPLEVRLVDVVPPEPARLLDLARQVITIDDDLPPVRLVPELLDVRALAATAPGGSGVSPEKHYLLPCRGAGLDLPGTVDYLDQRPTRADWTLIGCERSRQFHRWFYGGEPDRQVELCPDRQAEGSRAAADRATLTVLRCCLLERGIRVEDGRAVVPWGANLSEVQAALRALTGTDPGEIVWTRSTLP